MAYGMWIWLLLAMEARKASEGIKAVLAAEKSDEEGEFLRPEQLLETIQEEQENAASTIDAAQVPLPKNIGNTEATLNQKKKQSILPRAAKKAAVKGSRSGSDMVIFYVPQGYWTSIQRVTIPKMNEWQDILQEIHLNVGCAEFLRKPSLQWKISKKAKPRIMGLKNAMHWEDLKSEVEQEETKKKNSVMSVDLLIDDEYIESLQAQLIMNYKPSGKKGAKGVKFTPLNLDADPNVATPDGHIARVLPPTLASNDEASMCEKLAYNEILTYLTSCKDCPHIGSYCARKENGAHVCIPNPMVKDWAKFLGSQVIGVTHEVPPKVPKWDFYYRATACVSNPQSKAQAPAGPEGDGPDIPIMVAPVGAISVPSGSGASEANMLLLSLMQMQMQSMQFMQSMRGGALLIHSQAPLPFPSLATPIPAQAHDLTDICLDPTQEYTPLDVFFENLESKYPWRDLNGIMRKLVDRGMGTIDEFTLWKEEELVEKFRLLAGEVQWILREAKTALKAVA
ncbi:hypothetical protein K439DRAFT_1610948 [Ramaria rubella]|nr:hypothetical protein K439DRAFT_1610948 [Ramaria rubella]